MSGPTLAVLIPVYNASRFLAATLDSVLSQDRPPDELIILDNASTDDTLEVARRYADRPGVRIHCNETNIGIVPNWQRVGELATADLLMWVPGDDLLLPGCLSAAIATMAARPQVKLYFGSHTIVDEDGKWLGRSPERALPTGEFDGREFVQDLVLHGQPNAVAGTVIRRTDFEAIGGYDLRFRGAMDYDLYLRVGALGPVYREPMENAAFRVHPEQWTFEVMARDNGDMEVLFDKIPEYEFLTPTQQRQMVQGICDYSRHFFTRRIRNPAATVAELHGERQRVAERLRRWKASGKPQARYVRYWPRRPLHFLAWLMGATAPGVWAIHRLTSLGLRRQ